MITKTLSIQLLTKMGACHEYLDFVKRNKLENFPIARLSEIEGEYKLFKYHLTQQLEGLTCNSKGTMRIPTSKRKFPYRPCYDGAGHPFETWPVEGLKVKYTYDGNGRLLTHANYFHGMRGYSGEYTYDDKGNILTYENSDGDYVSRTYTYHPTGQLHTIHLDGKLEIRIPLI